MISLIHFLFSFYVILVLKFLIGFLFFVIIFSYILKLILICIRKKNRGKRKRIIGFFHPSCMDMGGGEKVLIAAMKSVELNQENDLFKNSSILLYHDNKCKISEFIQKAEERFQIKFNPKFEIKSVNLGNCDIMKPFKYKILTLIQQGIGSIRIGLRAIWYYPCDIFIDTLGVSWPYPFIKFFGTCRIISYTHYPIISSDMIKRIWNQKQNYNNKSIISKSKPLTFLKLIYYFFLQLLYGFTGKSADLMFANSTWTRNHLVKLFKNPDRCIIL